MFFRCPEKMRAIVKPAPVPGLVMKEVPGPGINEVLIKIRKTSIGGTDVHINKWDSWAQPSLIIGHGAGLIGAVIRPVARRSSTCFASVSGLICFERARAVDCRGFVEVS